MYLRCELFLLQTYLLHNFDVFIQHNLSVVFCRFWPGRHVFSNILFSVKNRFCVLQISKNEVYDSLSFLFYYGEEAEITSKIIFCTCRAHFYQHTLQNFLSLIRKWFSFFCPQKKKAFKSMFRIQFGNFQMSLSLRLAFF